MSDPAPEGDNLTLEDRLRPIAQVYAADMTALLVQREEINKSIRSLREQAKEDGLPHLKLLDARLKLQARLTPQEQADLARTDLIYQRFLRMPTGSQMDAFGDDRIPDAHQNVLSWETRGHQDGLAGRGWPNDLPEGLPEEARQPYAKGWEEGQTERQESYQEVARRKEAKPAPKADKPKRGRKAKADPVLFDETDSAMLDAEAQRLRDSGFTTITEDVEF